MYKRTEHNRFSGIIYGNPQGADIPSSINISMRGIPAGTLKAFAIAQANAITETTYLRRIAGIDEKMGNAKQLSFIRNIVFKLREAI